ncbi:hypothetical protein [Streptomyces lavendofoliae]|uniref:hypothetical protein n=1 Tax=Streptomyces lavendofoliae TaxID=67314 RepID=UPI003D922BAA
MAGWLERHREIVVEFVVRGEINPTTLPVLHQVAADGHVVAAMDPAPDSAAHQSNAAVRPLLTDLISAPTSTVETLPLNLAPDGDLTARASRSGRADADAARVEIERRRAFPAPARQAEDALRGHLHEKLAARSRTASSAHPGPADRPSSAAARAKSTTRRRTSSTADHSASPDAAQPSHPRRHTTNPGPGRGCGPTV